MTCRGLSRMKRGEAEQEEVADLDNTSRTPSHTVSHTLSRCLAHPKQGGEWRGRGGGGEGRRRPGQRLSQLSPPQGAYTFLTPHQEGVSAYTPNILGLAPTPAPPGRALSSVSAARCLALQPDVEAHNLTMRPLTCMVRRWCTDPYHSEHYGQRS